MKPNPQYKNSPYKATVWTPEEGLHTVTKPPALVSGEYANAEGETRINIMKALINLSELPFPVFFIGKDSIGDVHVEVTSKQLAFWKKAAKDFTKMQEEMHAAVDKYEPSRLRD